jgi:hypothetical protein
MLASMVKSAVAIALTSILVVSAYAGGPPFKYEEVYGSFWDDSIGINFNVYSGSSAEDYAYIDFIDHGTGQWFYCGGNPGSKPVDVNGSATKGSGEFKTADMDCYSDGMPIPEIISFECASDGTHEYSSIGKQTLKTEEGKETWHGKYADASASCTLTINEAKFDSTKATLYRGQNM